MKFEHRRVRWSLRRVGGAGSVHRVVTARSLRSLISTELSHFGTRHSLMVKLPSKYPARPEATDTKVQSCRRRTAGFCHERPSEEQDEQPYSLCSERNRNDCRRQGRQDSYGSHSLSSLLLRWDVRSWFSLQHPPNRGREGSYRLLLDSHEASHRPDSPLIPY
jgi:hypothetical protein